MIAVRFTPLVFLGFGHDQGSANFSKRIYQTFIKYGSNFGVATTANSDTVNFKIAQRPSDLS